MPYTVEQAPEIVNPVDSALNELSEGVEQNIRVHEVFGNLDDMQIQVAMKILNNSLDV